MSSTRGILRPLVLAGIAIASSCAEPPTSGAIGPSTSTASIATAAKKHARSFTPTSFGRPVAEKAAGAGSRPITTDHTVFGPVDRLQYFGGRVISNVLVVAVDWTSAVDPAISSYLPGFFTTVTASPYFTWLAEYDTVGLKGAGDGLPGSNQTIGYGTFDDTYVITPTLATTTTIDDSGIQEELLAQLAAGSLPAPVTDGAGNVDSLYVIDFPAGYTITLDGMTSCSSFCGYHGTFQYGPSSLSVPYAVLMDMSLASPCHTGCGTNKDYVDNSTSVHSHELVEAITDTEIGLNITSSGRPIAWYDETDTPGGEAADLCNEIQAVIDGYTVQAIWSNANDACIAEAPLCNGTSSPPSCTPCAASDDGVGCNGTKPACETDSTNVDFGQCVACASDTDCHTTPSTPICGKSSGPSDDTCRACTAADCAGATPVCGISGFDEGRCVQCDIKDTSACTGATPYCNTLSFQCVACVADMDCAGDTPVCDVLSETCRACKSSDACGGGVCDTSTGACVGCLQDSDCASSSCNTRTDTCQCDESSQCANPTPVCGSGKTCIGCKNDGDCAGSSSGKACSAGSCVQCVTSADCTPPTPVCHTATNTCAAERDAGAEGSTPPPPADSGPKRKDAGASAGQSSVITGGCAAAPTRGEDGSGGTALLATAGVMAIFARRRRRLGDSR